MGVVIILIIAFWFLDLPLALQILMTIFGSLTCIASIVRIVRKTAEGARTPRRTGIPELDRFIK